MGKSEIKLELIYRKRTQVYIPVLKFKDWVLHTASIFFKYPDGVLLIKKHDHPQTYLHFDQDSPCILVQIDGNGLAQGFHSSDSGKKHHSSLLVSDIYFVLIPNKKGITANDFIATQLIDPNSLK